MNQINLKEDFSTPLPQNQTNIHLTKYKNQ